MRNLLITLLATTALTACDPTKVDDDEYKQRYTVVICRQMDAAYLDAFSSRQKGKTKEETFDYVTQGNAENIEPQFMKLIKTLLDDVYSLPIYYPELNKPENGSLFPSEYKDYKLYEDEFIKGQRLKCLDELTPYTKKNHERLFGNMHVPKPQ